jgi:GT2 family glycosyltransferase
MLPSLHYIHTGRNLGFAAGMNVGIRKALAHGARRILLVNPDTIACPDAIEQLEACLDAAPRTGIVGPTVLSRFKPDRIESRGMSYSRRTGRMRLRGAGDRVAEGPGRLAGPIEVVDGVTGCFMLLTREVIDAVGLLEEDYFFSFEDLAYCLEARRRGFQTVLAGGAIVYHEGGRSIGPTSPDRLYFATRNHLLMASRTGPTGRVGSVARAGCIVALNFMHAVRAECGSLPMRIAAVTRGLRDYAAGRFGSGL